VVDRNPEEVQRLRTSLRWLESHDKRLAIQKRSLQDQLAEVEAAIDRLEAEIAQARQRLEELLMD
jgi:predicted RNase H-like nuclease (RuvC/YqgF family)